MKKALIIIALALILSSIGGLFLFRNSFHPMYFAPKSFSSSAYTCKICGSTKSINTKYFIGYIPISSVEEIKYRAPDFSTCNHVWERGISSAYPDPIDDGHVILVRKNNRYGAFILQNQRIEPEAAQYRWWYQTDGSGILDKSSQSVSIGDGATPRIKFMDIDISWSGSTEGQGWIYFNHSPGDDAAQDELHICITNLKSVDNLNAADPKWHYKATPVD